MNNYLECSAWMQRMSTSTGLIIKDSFVLQDIVGMLSYPEQGSARLVSVTDTSRVAS